MHLRSQCEFTAGQQRARPRGGCSSRHGRARGEGGSLYSGFSLVAVKLPLGCGLLEGKEEEGLKEGLLYTYRTTRGSRKWYRNLRSNYSVSQLSFWVEPGW